MTVPAPAFSALDVSSPRPVVQSIAAAARKTGVDFDYLLATAERESGLRVDAQAKTSSARGLFQFIEQTWLSVVHRHGAAHGLGDEAAAITQGQDGRYEVADRTRKREILALREDPVIASALAAELTRDNAEIVAGKIGRAPRSEELYLAHFLGASGAARLITAAEQAPQVSAAAEFPAAAAANRSIFYTSSGQERSLAEVYARLTHRHDRGADGAEGQPRAAQAAFGKSSDGPSAAATFAGQASSGDLSFTPRGGTVRTGGQAPLALTPEVISILASLDPLGGRDTQDNARRDERRA